MLMTTTTLRVQNLINSLLTEMITPQTYMYTHTYKYIPYSRKSRWGIKLGGWRISQPAAKLKSTNIKSFLYFAHAKAIVHCEANWWVWSWH